MKYYIGCDAHKKYSVFTVISEYGEISNAKRVGHERKEYRDFLNTLPPASEIAIETTGNWYWMIDEIEKTGHIPLLAHAGKAKLMMGQINKTDKLDAKGLAIMLKNGTLPAVWIPSGELRDQRELPRMRLAMSQVRTKLKIVFTPFLPNTVSPLMKLVISLVVKVGNCWRSLWLSCRRKPGSRFKSNSGCLTRWNNPSSR